MTLDAVETRTLANVKVRIVYDPDPANPRDNDNYGTMVCWHNRYKLGDEHRFDDPEEFITDLIGEAAERIEAWYERQYQKIPNVYTSRSDDPVTKGAIAALLKTYHERRWAEAEKVAIILPLYLYDHSGITISTTPFSCPWDSGRVGYVYMTKKDARERYGRLTKKNVELALSALRQETATYDEYLSGQVYGYIVETLPVADEDGEIDDDAEGETLDSCWGFFGLDYCLQEAMEVAESENQHIEQAKAGETADAV